MIIIPIIYEISLALTDIHWQIIIHPFWWKLLSHSQKQTKNTYFCKLHNTREILHYLPFQSRIYTTATVYGGWILYCMGYVRICQMFVRFLCSYLWNICKLNVCMSKNACNINKQAADLLANWKYPPFYQQYPL